MKKYEFEFCDISLHISKQNMLIYIYTGVIDYVPYIYSIKKTSTTHGLEKMSMARDIRVKIKISLQR